LNLTNNIISFILSASVHSLIVAFIIKGEKLIKSDTSMIVVNLVESFPSAQSQTNYEISNPARSKKNIIINKQIQDIKKDSISITKKVRTKNYDNKQVVTNYQIRKKVNSKKTKNINQSNTRSSISENVKSSAKYKIGTIKNPHPEYPMIARKKGWQGRLLLAVHIDKNGNVLNVDVSKTSGFDVLDRISVKTIKNWEFLPARYGESNIEDYLNIPISFKLID